MREQSTTPTGQKDVNNKLQPMQAEYTEVVLYVQSITRKRAALKSTTRRREINAENRRQMTPVAPISIWRVLRARFPGFLYRSFW